jgi:tetratricopeptide (TPR) repeat protein
MKTEIILDKLRPIREEGFPELYKEEEYIDLVQSLGVDEAEWQQLQEAFGEFLQEGKKQLQENQLEEAQELLEKALLIRQDDVETLSALSEVHLRLWRNNGSADDSYKAERYARRCLLIQPDHEAAQTRLAIIRPNVNIEGSANSKRVIILVALMVALALMGIIAYMVLANAAPPHDVGSFH